MATRLYPLPSTPSWAPSLYRGAWDANYSTTYEPVTSVLAEAAAGSNTPKNVRKSVTDAQDLAWLQCVSETLDVDQTISGTFDVGVGCNEQTAENDASFFVHIWVSQGDTDTARGTLLTNYAATTEFTTSLLGRALDSAQSLASVNAIAGDRIIVELGVRMLGSDTGFNTNCQMRYGGTGDDVVVGEGSTTIRNSWVQFSQDITFGTPAGGGGGGGARTRAVIVT